MNRRMFLKTAGAAVVITGMAASGAWLGTRSPVRAVEPWQHATLGYGDVRLDALAYAILAPSPHNRQPWQVSLVSGNAIDVYCDLNKLLPETDPFNRQIVIGMGCFIELYKMAAENLGYKAIIESFPDGEAEPLLDARRIARITLEKAKRQIDPLFDTVLARRSTKEPFDTTQVVASSELSKLTALNTVSGTVNSENIASLNHFIYEGMKVEFETKRTLKESADLMRLGKAEVEASPDGIDITGAPMELFVKTGILTREQFADPASALTQDYLNRTKQTFNTSAGYVWIISPQNTRINQLQAGRDYVRLNLKATQLGLAIQPVSQTLQEYPEMKDLYQGIHTHLGASGAEKVQMLARIGYSNVVDPSPRWPLQSILLEA